MKYSTTLITILLLCLISSFSYAEDESGSYEAVQQNISDLQKEEVTTDNIFSNYEDMVEYNFANSNEVEIIPNSKPKFRRERHILVVKEGETFIGILTNLGMDAKTATDAFNTLRKIYDPRNLKIGQSIELIANYNEKTHQFEKLDRLAIIPEPNVKYVLSVNHNGNFESKVEFEKDKDVVKVISGTIGVSPYDSMVKAGLSDNIANEIICQFSYFINFRTDIHTDDVFNVKYSENKSNEKDTSTTTNFLFASIQTAKKTYKIYRFNDKYYNEKGEAIKCITNIEDRESNTSNDLVGKDLRNFKENMLKINSLKNGDKWETPHFTKIYSENDTLANDGKIIYPGQSAVKARKKNNIEALDELRRKFPSNLLQAIEEIELTIDDNDKRNHRRIAMIYIKDGYEQSCRIIGYHAVQEMLNILMDEGYKPFDERIWVSAHIYQKVKGVTGQNMVIPFGKAIYNYTNDSIEWES